MNEKILIALSDQTLTDLIQQKLFSHGYTTVTAKSGEEALQKMQSEKPALVLLDLVLPGKSGYDVISEKSMDRMITKIPLIVVSNAGLPVDMNRLPSAPGIVKDYLIRPHVDPEEVLEKVRGAIGSPAVITTSAPANTASASAAGGSAGKKILWVEDDKFLGSILFKKFEASGHTVLPATNGDEAFAILEKQTPDIIILDILLPGLNGFDILQKIKGMEKFRDIPVIMLSNLSKPTDIERAQMLGAQKFLVKVTVSINEIIKEVDSLLKI
jgi:CheY-like chemotaxis protein